MGITVRERRLECSLESSIAESCFVYLTKLNIVMILVCHKGVPFQKTCMFLENKWHVGTVPRLFGGR